VIDVSAAETMGPNLLDDTGVAGPDVDQLYREHGNWLIALLRRRFGRQAAEDLAQDAYVRVVGSSTRIYHPRAFLARVAINAARDRARAAAVRPALLFGGSLVAAAGAEADQEQALLLKQIILALPPQLRDVFLLSRFGGLTYGEIAQRCGVSVKTVEARMSKALAICTALVQD
jgi:RNA polymerase sigma factor (sigma-70 family)